LRKSGKRVPPRRSAVAVGAHRSTNKSALSGARAVVAADDEDEEHAEREQVAVSEHEVPTTLVPAAKAFFWFAVSSPAQAASAVAGIATAPTSRARAMSPDSRIDRRRRLSSS